MLPEETGIDGWLRYAPLPAEYKQKSRTYKTIIAFSEDATSPVLVAGLELQNGLHGILGQKVEIASKTQDDGAGSIQVGTLKSISSTGLEIKSIPKLTEEGFWLSVTNDKVVIVGQNERGALYGAFEFLSRLAQGDFSETNFASNPSAPIRYTNHWDNLDDSGHHGSIERGYGGPSIFFKDGFVLDDLTRVGQLARLLASVRLNGAFVNNVNAGPALLNERNLDGLKRIADAMRPYGVRTGISVFFDSPKVLGGLPTSDPLDPAVVSWWKDITAKVYEQVPDLIGFLIKANSEGQPGPLTYGRTLADGANMFARALKPHGDGVVMYRAFVYNHHLDESNWKNDRANAAVEFFQHLDGAFDDNVIVQIKFGPIDFQVREPPSPLLASLRKTDAVIELMVAQEYLGQQSHYVYQAPLWKTILDFDFKIDGKESLVGRDILTGKQFGRKRNGYAAVTNVGNDSTWLGNHLSMSNLYAYGKLAWDPSLDPRHIVQEWIRLTFGVNQKVLDTITGIAMESWPTYENYTGNLGIQTLCDIIETHFGPGPANMDGNGWGQWTRADSKALGMDRTAATGTGYSSQYPPDVAARFEKIETTPDELLLWFHHVSYDHRLKSGKTVIQHFYDAHYEGAANAQTFPTRWSTLKGLVDDKRLEHVAFKLGFQAGHSLVWRDSINRFYLAKCGIADEKGRVNSHPGRIPAHSMSLDGYDVVDVDPPEAATDGKAVVASANGPATATTVLRRPSGTYDIAVNYYDHLGGCSNYELFLNEKSIGKWKGNLSERLGHAFSKLIDGHSATRIYFRGVRIDEGATLKIAGQPDGTEQAPIDYISILQPGTID